MIPKNKQHILGKWGEYYALFYILSKGYLPLKRNYKTTSGEIDLIARKGKSIIFIEIKSRKNKSHFTESISRKQQKRIEQTAYLFMQHNQKYKGYGMQIDALLYTPPFGIKHIKNAW